MLGKTRGVVGALICVLGSSLLACGSAPPPATPVATAPSSATPVVEAEDAPSGPLPQVSAPAELFALGRISNPEQFVDVISGWIHIPIPLEIALEKELPSLRKQVALDAPIEVAATLDPDELGDARPLFAVSVPLKDYGAALSALRERGIGVDRINRDSASVSLPGEQSCVVSRANGVASARLICGDARHDVDVLAPYMARTLPMEALTPTALYIEVRAEPLRQRFGKQAHLLKVGVPILLREASLGNARFDAAVADAVHASANELLALLDEADKLVIKANTGANKEALQFDVGLKLNGGKSWTSAALNARVADSATAPEMAWRLPGDVSTAGFSTGVRDAKLWQPILDNLAEVLGGGLDYLELKGRAYPELVAAFRDLGGMTGASVYGKGTQHEGAKAQNAALAEMGPWATIFEPGTYALGGVDGDAGRFKRLLDATVAAYNDPAWRKELAKRADKAELTKLPSMSKKPAPAELGLPKGSVLYELNVTAALVAELQKKTERPASKGSLPLSILLTSDGSRTWLGYGMDKALLASKLKQVLTGPADTALGARPGLEAWRKEAVVTGGFWSVAELADSVAHYANALNDTKTGGDGAPRVNRDTLTLAMPNKGKTPVLYAMKVEPGPTLWLSFVAPSQAMEDVAAGTVAIIAQMGDAF